MGKAFLKVRYDNNVLQHQSAALYSTPAELKHILKSKVAHTAVLDGLWGDHFSLSENFIINSGCEKKGQWTTPVAITIRFLRHKSDDGAKFKVMGAFTC